MSAARARVHAMFTLDETAEQELDARLDEHRAEVRTEVWREAAAEAESAVTLYPEDRHWGQAVAGALEGLVDRFRRKAGEQASRTEEATAAAATATPDFFQVGHTYTDSNGYQAPELVTCFLVEHITRHPDRGHLRAIGWLRNGAPGEGWHGGFRDEDEYAGWTDTGAGAR